MDLLALAGIVLGVIAIVLGNFMEGGAIGGLLNGPAALIVFGGTFAATLVQTPAVVLQHALQRCIWIVFPPRFDYDDLLDQICHWASAARREGLLGLEKLAEIEHNLIARKGLKLLADGQTAENIRNSLEIDLFKQEENGHQAANVYENMGGYAPTIGIIGAVLGLMQVLNNISTPEQLGPGIATAFVATIYGVGSANLIFIPVGQRLKSWVKREYVYHELIIEGLVAIAEGEHPNAIRYRFEIIRRG
jgi:chemotaxis protein MotA